MRIDFPDAKDLLIAIAILILLTWQVQLGLGIISVILILCKHWIIGGIIGLIASVAYTVKRTNHL